MPVREEEKFKDYAGKEVQHTRGPMLCHYVYAYALVGGRKHLETAAYKLPIFRCRLLRPLLFLLS